MESHVKDKTMMTCEYKLLKKERQCVRTKLKRELFNEHQHPGKSLPRKGRIKTLTIEDETLTIKISETDKEMSRLDYLINENFSRLDVSSKRLMDVLKLIARNSFYSSLQRFKEMYNNYRDDHTMFRNLTCAHGVICCSDDQVDVQLFPTAHHPPVLRRIIDDLFSELNLNDVCFPDGSGRKIVFKLGEKSGIRLASQKADLGGNY